MTTGGHGLSGKARRIKRDALSLAALAVAFYVGFIVWLVLQGSIAG